MNYKDAVNYLNSLETFGSKLGLARVKLLLKKLVNPERNLKCFHIAGTNGKGSVCAMISNVLQQAGYKVGMYTSPHLVDFKERFLINNKKIPEKDVARLLTKIKPLANEVAKELEQPTYFEVTSAMAFQYFKEKKVDYAVAEVGLGGRLDATNVIERPLVSIITNIDLEHTDVLGETIGEIAFEKAGIIKAHTPVVTAASNSALGVFKKVADERNSPLIKVNPHYNGKVGLQGDFQKQNAAIAVEAIEQSKVRIKENEIARGIGNVYWPGRLDLRKIKRKNILFDCAHNPACVRVLIPELKKFSYENLILVAGILKDKDYKQMLKLLEGVADKIILTKPNIVRAQDPEILANCLKKEPDIILNSGAATNHALALAGKNDLILIAGSMYLIGEAMAHLKAKVF